MPSPLLPRVSAVALSASAFLASASAFFASDAVTTVPVLEVESLSTVNVSVLPSRVTVRPFSRPITPPRRPCSSRARASSAVSVWVKVVPSLLVLAPLSLPLPLLSAPDWDGAGVVR